MSDPTSSDSSEADDSLARRVENLLSIEVEGDPSLSLEDAKNLVRALNEQRLGLSCELRRSHRLINALTNCTYRVRVENGRIVETIRSANCEVVSGYSPKEFRADPDLWLKIIPPEDRDLVERLTARVLAGEEPGTVEHRIRHRDGSLRWVSHATCPEHDERGKLVGYDGIVRDVTRQHAALESLRILDGEEEDSPLDREDRLRLVAEHTRLLAAAVSHLGEGVMITDEELDPPGPRILFVNEALCRMTGYSVDELIGRSPRILQGEETAREARETIRRELAAGRGCRVELVNYRKDGSRYDAELSIAPLHDAHAGTTSFVAIQRDVTERNRAAADLRDRNDRLGALFDGVMDAIVSIDERGIIDGVNHAASSLFGYEPDELVGGNVSILMPSPHAERHDGYIARYLATEEPRIVGTRRDLQALHRDGRTFPIELTVSRVDHTGRFIGVIRDVTERRELERRLLTIASEEQEWIGRELHDGVGQEIAGLAMLAQTIATLIEREKMPSAEAARQLVTGLESANGQVRALSRGLYPVEIDSRGLGTALANLRRQVEERSGIHCVLEAPDEVSTGGRDASTHLYRIAQEAVNNAIRHGRPQRIDIHLSERDGFVTLAVVDNGIGIDRNAGNGDGLGLRLMQYRADLVGGRFEVSTPPAGGTSVVCKVPIASDADTLESDPGPNVD